MRNHESELLYHALCYEEGHPRRTQHILKVYTLAKLLGEKEALSEKDRQILQAAAILHDIAIKYCKEHYAGDACQANQQREAPHLMCNFLDQAEYPAEYLPRILELVLLHHDYTDQPDPLLRLLIEADLIVNCYHDPQYTRMLHEQIEKLLHTSNLFYNVPAIEAAKLFNQAAGMEQVFFTNSGTEAIEGAIKIAKKYFYDRHHTNCGEIIAMKKSFHGRSMGALSLTGKEAYQAPFGPMLSYIRFAEFNNLDSVRALITENTCAICLETVQGEGGIYPAADTFIQGKCDDE